MIANTELQLCCGNGYEIHQSAPGLFVALASTFLCFLKNRKVNKYNLPLIIIFLVINNILLHREQSADESLLYRQRKVF